MAAPTVSSRATPVGILLPDGFSSKISFSRDTDISLWELEISPPGEDNGAPINITTMWNIARQTKAPRALNEATDASFKFAYDPAVRGQIRALCGQEGAITFLFPDGTTETIWGYLKDAKFDALVSGAMPSGSGTIVETDYDPSARSENGPVLASVAGT